MTAEVAEWPILRSYGWFDNEPESERLLVLKNPKPTPWRKCAIQEIGPPIKGRSNNDIRPRDIEFFKYRAISLLHYMRLINLTMLDHPPQLHDTLMMMMMMMEFEIEQDVPNPLLPHLPTPVKQIGTMHWRQ